MKILTLSARKSRATDERRYQRYCMHRHNITIENFSTIFSFRKFLQRNKDASGAATYRVNEKNDARVRNSIINF